MAGIEPIVKRDKGIWYIKTQRCTRCGKCCMNVPENYTHGRGADGNCQHLKYEANEYLCDLGAKRPYICCVGDGFDDCNIKWEKI